MPRMTFTKDFARDLSWASSVHYLPGQTYDVPDDLVAEVTAEAAAAPETAAAEPPPAAPTKED